MSLESFQPPPEEESEQKTHKSQKGNFRKIVTALGAIVALSATEAKAQHLSHPDSIPSVPVADSPLHSKDIGMTIQGITIDTEHKTQVKTEHRQIRDDLPQVPTEDSPERSKDIGMTILGVTTDKNGKEIQTTKHHPENR